ncbi:hypothetical protein Goari_024903 [Gossypium aridum]|uniref:Uncharacterized protein n=1 Tax=Gossypium aridum TaxID=34290 RepID=A0A7J8X7I7_GOSAI|nr:hypothetical protein [Gossypium aridum]
MEEGDKSTGVGGETSTRVSAGSTSWLSASRQRFTIELRPGETTIVSWKRLIKDAQDTSPHLTAPNTEDSLEWNVIINSYGKFNYMGWLWSKVL